MNDWKRMKIIQCFCHILDDLHLNAFAKFVAKGFTITLKEVGEIFIHQFHCQKGGSTLRMYVCLKVLNNIYVLELSQKYTFTLKFLLLFTVDAAVEGKKQIHSMQHLDSTRRTTSCGLPNISKCTSTNLIFWCFNYQILNLQLRWTCMMRRVRKGWCTLINRASTLGRIRETCCET